MEYPAPIFPIRNPMRYLTSTLRQALAKTAQLAGIPQTINAGNSYRDFVFTAFCECDQFFFIGTNYGLFLKNKSDGSLQFLHQHNSKLPDNHVTSLACTKERIALIGTRKGLFVWEPNTSFVLTCENANISDNRITALTIDQEDQLWLGTQEGGLVKSEGDIKNNFNFRSIQTIKKNIFSLTTDPRGYVWVAFKDGALDYFKNGMSYSSIPLQYNGEAKFILQTFNEGLFLTDGIQFDEIYLDPASGNISCAYYNPKYSRMILCNDYGINIFTINDPWSGHRYMPYSAFIQSISYRCPSPAITILIKEIRKYEHNFKTSPMDIL